MLPGLQFRGQRERPGDAGRGRFRLVASAVSDTGASTKALEVKEGSNQSPRNGPCAPLRHRSGRGSAWWALNGVIPGLP
jgi:hypothetical protein